MTNTLSPLVDTYPQYPFEIAKGEGSKVFDTDGNSYLDLYGGHAVCSIGHCHPKLTEALKKQADELIFYSNLTPLAVRTKAAEMLIQFADCHLSSVFFCNSGAESNEHALKLALQLTGRKEIVALTGGFHGRTTLCAAATDNKKWHKRNDGWIREVKRIAPNSTKGLEVITQETAAVILEPIQSIGGVTVLTTEFLSLIRKRCDQTGTLLIFDEIQTGVGRTGTPFANHHWGVKANISTSAKSLGGGVPVGAILMTADIAKEIKLGDLGSTFGGSPLAMAGIISVLSVIQDENLLTHVKSFERYARKSLEALDLISEVRGKGCLLGLSLNPSAFTPSDTLAKDITTTLRDNYEILAGTSGVSNVMRLLPPLNTELTAIDTLASALSKIGAANA